MDLSTELPTLDRAADEAVRDVVPPAAGELWARGDRWRRRRRRGTAVVLTLGVVLVAALAGLTVQRAAAPEPAVAPDGGPTLPSRMYDVSPWLPVGMPGEPVVAVQSTYRSTWTGDVPAIAVVTGSGRYLFLDVGTDLAAGDVLSPDVALSPDGERVAYWLLGDPDGSPNTSRHPTITGVAVTDVVTGETRRHRFPSEHGISPEALVWSGATTLVGGYATFITGDDGPKSGRGAAVGAPSWQWDVSGRRSPVTLPTAHVDASAAGAGGRVLVGRRLVTLATGEVRRVPGLSDGSSSGVSGAALRADGTFARVGGGRLPDREPNQVTVADVDAARPEQRVVPGTEESVQVLGWRDDDHLVVVRRVDRSAPGTWDESFAMASVDMVTGATEVLVEGGWARIAPWSWASDLLSAPVVEAVEPPHPLDPRLVTGLTVVALLGTAGVLVGWRRRARP